MEKKRSGISGDSTEVNGNEKNRIQSRVSKLRNEQNTKIRGSGGRRRVFDLDQTENIVYNRQISEAEKKRRLEGLKKHELIRKKQISAICVIAAMAVVTAIVMFMTPLFNIKEIRVEGNNIVSMETIKPKLSGLIGENLFRTKSSTIKSKLLELSQVSDADVKKNLFPPSLVVTIKETTPAAYFLYKNKVLVIDTDLKIIDDNFLYNTDTIPSVNGLTVPSYKLNEKLEKNDKTDVLNLLLNSLQNTGLLEKTTYIDIDDTNKISFNYDNRLEADCGSQYELQRKIKMFSEAINSENMSSSAIGSMDLSVPGKAVYTP